MSRSHEVSSHLNIRLDEYDARIRTFVPWYDEMLDIASGCVSLIAKSDGVLLDLGIGTGALSQKCRMRRRDLRIVGIDADAAILEFARDRLGHEGVELRNETFTAGSLPKCDVAVSSLALHHLAPSGKKREFYRGLRVALDDGGVLVLADCYLPSSNQLVDAGFKEWREFLEFTYSSDEAKEFLETWSVEDTYFPLNEELTWLREAGFAAETSWRRGLFAVLVCT